MKRAELHQGGDDLAHGGLCVAGMAADELVPQRDGELGLQRLAPPQTGAPPGHPPAVGRPLLGAAAVQ